MKTTCTKCGATLATGTHFPGCGQRQLNPIKVSGGWMCWTWSKSGQYVQVFVPE
jgi:hypothetical protein